jgi:hypothetical protein
MVGDEGRRQAGVAPFSASALDWAAATGQGEHDLFP